MAVNPLFQSFHEEIEQELHQDLFDESIQIHGIDVFFIPRVLVNEDYLFAEDPSSAFEEAFEIEMYLETFDQYEGDGDLLSKFGLHIKDQMTLNVSQRRFVAETDLEKPLEGDLIYMPLTKAIFEIKFREHEEQFYALGTRYNWKLQCELFEFSREDFDTGLEEVDSLTDELDDSDGFTGTDPFASNAEIETEGDAAIDHTQDDIFGVT